MNRLPAIATVCSTVMLAFAVPVSSRATDTTEPAKKTVTTAADLPAFTYKVPAQLDTLLTSDATWEPFAAAMRANLEGVLHDYAIEDRKTLQSIERDLMLLDLDANRNAGAEAHLARVLDLEEKPETKAFGTETFLVGAILHARRAAGASYGTTYHAALSKTYAASLAALSTSVSARVARVRGFIELASPELPVTIVKAQLAPMAAKNGNTLDSDAASFMLWVRTLHHTVLATRPELLPALVAHLTAHPPPTVDIWAARDVALDGNANLTPVTIAIWDEGVDTTMFPGRLFVNPKESDNGRDNDGNGYIADVHGIAFDLHHHRTSGMLHPVDAADRAQFPRLIEENQAMRDLHAGIDNERTRALKAKMQGMTPAQLTAEERLPRVFMGYWHGTAVANMAVAGNPAVRLLSARMTWEAVDPAAIPGVIFDDAWARDFAASITDTVAYFKTHGVRVANLSWGLTADDIVDNLRRAGVIGDEAERQRLANERLATIRAAMQATFADAPDILFVVAAGNDDNDTTFHQSLPDTIDLPNVLSVGAVDQAGAAAFFTSFGKQVKLYAKGVDLEALLPGGARIVSSGTSFAAPQVVNLAAKLLAVNPKLTTAEVVKLIRNGARAGEDKRLVLINPKRSMELLSKTVE